MTDDLTYIAEGLRGLAVPINNLHIDPANARAHHALDRIAASLKAYGQRKPIIENRLQGVNNLAVQTSVVLRCAFRKRYMKGFKNSQGKFSHNAIIAALWRNSQERNNAVSIATGSLFYART